MPIKKPPQHRDAYIRVRLEPDLKEDVQEKSKPYGGLSAVIRAMLKTFAGGERNFDPEEALDERTQAPKRKKGQG